MVREYTELLVLNCYICKFCMILKLPISHHDNLYLKYRPFTNIRFFTELHSIHYNVIIITCSCKPTTSLFSACKKPPNSLIHINIEQIVS
ncbi:hypothetical protein Hanom_Chr04g00322671 [Helianthus anomalus]